MALTGEIVVDTATGELFLDGVAVEWDFTGGEPALADVGERTLPAVRVTIPCAQLSVISSSTEAGL